MCWCMLFIDDIILENDIKEGINAKLKWWRKELESQGFKSSQSKTEYKEY